MKYINNNLLWTTEMTHYLHISYYNYYDLRHSYSIISSLYVLSFFWLGLFYLLNLLSRFNLTTTVLAHNYILVMVDPVEHYPPGEAYELSQQESVLQIWPYLDNFLTNPIHILAYSSDLGSESPEYHKIS